MSDNPYPNASDTMHYELHTAWDEGYAEGFAAGRAAATPACDHPPYGPKSPCPECRAAATPDPPPDDLCAVVFRALHSSRNTQMSDEMRAAYIASVITAEAAPAASPDERLREALAIIGKIPQEQLARIMAAADRDGSPDA